MSVPDRKAGDPEPSAMRAGLYEALLTRKLAESLSRAPSSDLQTWIGALDPAEAPAYLAQHLARVLERALRDLEGPAREDLLLRLLGDIAAAAGDAAELRLEVHESPPRLLLAAQARSSSLAAASAPIRPAIPLSQNALLVNARAEHRIGAEIAREIASADGVDLLCSFLKWSGFRILEDAFRAHVQRRPGTLRVLTTCYTGATERRVLDALVSLGAQVRVSYDTRRTRLHAKAWLFHRSTGYSTAYVGSSNLSSAALHEGLEWNVRVSSIESPTVLARIGATVESYWADAEFEPYDPERDGERFDRAAQRERGEPDIPLLDLEVRPWPFQQEILDRLLSERRLHDRWRNLVVAATGTGKTIIAALDYDRMRASGGIGQARLLFVAHREEILTQSRSRFRVVLRDGSFGELLVGGQKPTDGTHVFASIQSLARVDLSALKPDHYDMVIFDEIHHGAAATYRRVLDHLKPRLLLGLTATPERSDGESILPWFDNRIAAELRLWEALERGLLCPFQYFGIADETDLSAIRWTRGQYDAKALEDLYTGDHARVLLILTALKRRVASVGAMRAIGFCVSIRHAEFMAQEFQKHGIPSAALSADSPAEERSQTLRRLREGDLNIVFAVDLLNEGVDVPELDTVLFLRPTQSATVFLQQLGRGLRLARGKEGLTVLDFVGRQAEGFRFDLKYRALLGGTKAALVRQIESGFPLLPSGCSLELDRVSQQIVLDNVRRALKLTTRTIVQDVRAMGADVTLREFLQASECAIEEFYRPDRTWTSVCREAGRVMPSGGVEEARLLRGLPRLVHATDPVWLERVVHIVRNERPPDATSLDDNDRRRLEMLHTSLWGREAVEGGLEEATPAIWKNAAVRAELLELLPLLRSELHHVPIHAQPYADVPLLPHCRYALGEVLAAFGVSKATDPVRLQSGVYFDRAHACDLLFVTLQKSESDYSPSTLYRDYAISQDLFHWESQNNTRAESGPGRRYRHHRELGSRVFLFVRGSKTDDAGRTEAYTFLGDADYVSHDGERPMSITWRLAKPMPAEFYAETAVKVG
jgi:superfamily II DNA or RNA helicase/HKD family nuclease